MKEAGIWDGHAAWISPDISFWTRRPISIKLNLKVSFENSLKPYFLLFQSVITTWRTREFVRLRRY